jgi:hypothetical protein
VRWNGAQRATENLLGTQSGDAGELCSASLLHFRVTFNRNSLRSGAFGVFGAGIGGFDDGRDATAGAE